MLLYPHDAKLLGLCFVIPTIFEVFRLIIAYVIAAPPKKMKELEQERMEAKLTLASIKSVQVEFVRHSKIQREIIRIERELESLQALQQPKANKIKNIMHIARIVLLVACGVYFGTQNVASITPGTLWPFSWISSEPTVAIHAWFFILVCSASMRHVFRTFALVLCPSVNIP